MQAMSTFDNLLLALTQISPGERLPPTWRQGDGHATFVVDKAFKKMLIYDVTDYFALICYLPQYLLSTTNPNHPALSIGEKCAGEARTTPVESATIDVSSTPTPAEFCSFL